MIRPIIVWRIATIVLHMMRLLLRHHRSMLIVVCVHVIEATAAVSASRIIAHVVIRMVQLGRIIVMIWIAVCRNSRCAAHQIVRVMITVVIVIIIHMN